MRKYGYDKYRCKTSGFTDMAISDFFACVGHAEARGIESACVKDYISCFEKAGFGDDLEEVGSFLRGHIAECESCREIYEEFKPEQRLMRSILMLYDTKKGAYM